MADNPSYSLSLLSEYTHTLDSLPIDLSRNFADLRELDAVLSSSVSSITTKIHTLTSMIEEGRASKEDRLWLLTEIAEEAQRLKLGGEDKIRVACQAADNLKAHSSHLRALTDQLPSFDSSVLDRTTVYPHVSERSYMPATTMETGRRRRGVLGSIMTNPDPSPAKRKRAPKDDDGDVGGSYRTPKKPATDNHGRARNNARVKKTDRAASPSDSLVSVTSHLPHHGRNGSHAISHPRAGGSSAGNNATNSSGAGTTANKRRTNGNNASHNTTSSTNRVPTPLANEAYPSHDTHHTSSRRGGGGGGGASNEYSVPPSASHPSLPAPYQNGSHGGNGGYDVLGVPLQDWNILRGAQGLEGPGMPVARSSSIHSTGLGAVGGAGGGGGGGGAGSTAGGGSVVDAGADGGDGDGDGDDRTYCFCDGVSYGEMIACDDARCEREWFHLACIGLTVPPEGTWYCGTCKSKKPAKRAVRGGKRRTGGTKN